MGNKVNILGVHFDRITMQEAVDQVIGFLESESTQLIYTANPEIVMLAKNNADFCTVINQGDLVVADGIGVVIGSKMIKRPLPERVAGYDLMLNIFNILKDTDKTVYFFGASPNVAQQAAERMMTTFPGLKIIGTHDGYFNKEEEVKIIEEINRLEPDLLLLGLGAPKQEKWLFEHKDQLNIKVGVGVGGSFDVMSGRLKRAPKIFIKLGIEWLYRLLAQPTRIKRMIKLPLFLWDVFLHGKNYSK